jgi:hypothetical protein
MRSGKTRLIVEGVGEVDRPCCASKTALNDSATLSVPKVILNQLRRKIGVTFGSRRRPLYGGTCGSGLSCAGQAAIRRHRHELCIVCNRLARQVLQKPPAARELLRDVVHELPVAAPFALPACGHRARRRSARRGSLTRNYALDPACVRQPFRAHSSHTARAGGAERRICRCATKSTVEALFSRPRA